MQAGPLSASILPPSKATYRKLEDIASGGMGSVEVACAVSGELAGRLVALKRLHAHLEKEKHFADMFFDEAWITAGLHHPNVVEILDWGSDRTGRYLALEFVLGDSLHGLIREAQKQRTSVPVDLAIIIVARAAEGLHAAHELRNERGQLLDLVHRDVSPSNILVGVQGEIKLIDFGVAKARDRLAHTSTGTLKGKFGYMSPEQARGQALDRRSDVFSLGIVLWELLAARRLFRSESELETMRMIVEDPPSPIRAVRPDVPESLSRVLMAALAKNRDDRLGSCAEFSEFLWSVFREQGYHTDEHDVARFFTTLMQDRCEQLSKLVTTAETVMRDPGAALAEPASPDDYERVHATMVTMAHSEVRRVTTSVSGSFAGAAPQPGGLIVPATGTGVAPARSTRSAALFGALIGIGAVSLVGLGWVIAARNHGSVPVVAQPAMATATSAPGTTTAALVPAVPAAPTASVPVILAPTPTAVRPSAPTAGSSAAVPVASAPPAAVSAVTLSHGTRPRPVHPALPAASGTGPSGAALPTASSPAASSLVAHAPPPASDPPASAARPEPAARVAPEHNAPDHPAAPSGGSVRPRLGGWQ